MPRTTIFHSRLLLALAWALPATVPSLKEKLMRLPATGLTTACRLLLKPVTSQVTPSSRGSGSGSKVRTSPDAAVRLKRRPSSA